MPTTEQRVEHPMATHDVGRRPRVLLRALVVALAAVVAIGASVLIIGSNSETPEEVVASFIDAVDRQDLWAVRDVLDPDVVATFDATPVGFTGGIQEEVGRDTLLRNMEQEWLSGQLTFTEEILSSDGETVKTDLTVTFPDGTFTRHEVTYHVSDDGLIYREEHVVVE